MDKTGCLLLAAGSGERLNASVPKAFIQLAGVPLVAHALNAALRVPDIEVIVIAVPRGWEKSARVAATRAAPSARKPAPRVEVIAGGATRMDSVALSVAALGRDIAFVLVHDAARALAPPHVFESVVGALRDGAEAVVPVVPVVDTIKVVDWDGGDSDREVVHATPDRSSLRIAQTPQGFRRATLERALARTVADTAATDDASLVEALGIEVRVIPGDRDAFKLTYPPDVILAEVLLQHRRERGRRTTTD